MFIYALRIFDYFRQPAISVAILCDASPTWRPQYYAFELPHTKLKFEFGTVKLLDYKQRLPELDANPNPFAFVVKTHLKLQETKQDSPSRKVWKLRLIHELYEQGYNQEQVLNLFNFLDWVLVLPKRLEQEFWQELKAYEEERQMPYITSVERIGYDRGKQEGRQEGLQSVIVLLLEQKLGELPQSLRDRISVLSPQTLEVLAIDLLNFGAIEDLANWLQNHSC